jgi:hypothetical protein
MEATYSEESFGILTDDDLVLDCILVKPIKTADGDLKAIRAWVPRYPLTKASVITCARQEVDALGSEGRVAHLVFDLRGTGESEGAATDHNFGVDLRAVRLWAQERFGDISVGFLGRPHGREQVDVRPIRPGVVMETYHFRPEDGVESTPLLYLSTFGAFSASDEATCHALSRSGYDVIAMDPLRYLLHASAQGRLTARDLWDDAQIVCDQIPAPPLILGQPVGAGLALFWASGVENFRGVLALGLAQRAFRPSHIFANNNPHTFFLARQVHKITPRPVAYVRESAHPLGGSRDELAALHQTSGAPRRLEEVEQATDDLLFHLLDWLKHPAAEH